jgi:hypothetical protein
VVLAEETSHVLKKKTIICEKGVKFLLTIDPFYPRLEQGQGGIIPKGIMAFSDPQVSLEPHDKRHQCHDIA